MSFNHTCCNLGKSLDKAMSWAWMCDSVLLPPAGWQTIALQEDLTVCINTVSLSVSQRTMEMAAAATAVLTDVPGTMLLSDVLTSTASRKRLPTGSTFWEHSGSSRTVDPFAIPAGRKPTEWHWQQRNEGEYHETFVKGRVCCFEDFAVRFPFGFALVALAPFVVFRG